MSEYKTTLRFQNTLNPRREQLDTATFNPCEQYYTSNFYARAIPEWNCLAILLTLFFRFSLLVMVSVLPCSTRTRVCENILARLHIFRYQLLSIVTSVAGCLLLVRRVNSQLADLC